MDPDWVRSIRDQCQAAGVPFFFKQWGGVRKKQPAASSTAGRMTTFPPVLLRLLDVVRQRGAISAHHVPEMLVELEHGLVQALGLVVDEDRLEQARRRPDGGERPDSWPRPTASRNDLRQWWRGSCRRRTSPPRSVVAYARGRNVAIGLSVSASQVVTSAALDVDGHEPCGRRIEIEEKRPDHLALDLLAERARQAIPELDGVVGDGDQELCLILERDLSDRAIVARGGHTGSLPSKSHSLTVPSL